MVHGPGAYEGRADHFPRISRVTLPETFVRHRLPCAICRWCNQFPEFVAPLSEWNGQPRRRTERRLCAGEWYAAECRYVRGDYATVMVSTLVYVPAAMNGGTSRLTGELAVKPPPPPPAGGPPTRGRAARTEAYGRGRPPPRRGPARLLRPSQFRRNNLDHDGEADAAMMVCRGEDTSLTGVLGVSDGDASSAAA